MALREGLAALYGVQPQQLLVGRGSDEAIDLLVRALCAGRDGVLVMPPVFGMYAVCARLQGAALIEVPLVDSEDGLRADLDAVIDIARARNAKLVFLCAPSNPAGSDIALDEVERVVAELRGQALVVVDEAYVEYAQRPSATTLLAAHANLAAAHAVEGTRARGRSYWNADRRPGTDYRAASLPGAVPGADPVRRAGRAGPAAGRAGTHRRTRGHGHRRTRAPANGTGQPARCTPVYVSSGNYLLVRFADAQAAFDTLLNAGVVVRDQRRAAVG